MFVHHCSSCDKSQLIFPSQVRGVADNGGLAFTCWCGAEQVWSMGREIEVVTEARSAA
ncbi:hypothetical protein [Nocardioides daejeonensis]|uniref:hypothetical protein n=1 Tax=Nocardioides daejeonensis TaxID=1046556 RepID=UPI0013A54DF8|nr:hypothetical protein [Nocardioides daejeonensis]